MLAKKFSILVVDNDETARSFCFKALSHAMPKSTIRKIFLAATRQEARRHLASELPDLVFLDLKIDSGDYDSSTGLDLLQEITQTKKRTRVVVMTSSLDDNDRERAQTLGAIHFISKLLRFEWISAAVSQLNSAKEIYTNLLNLMPISQPSIPLAAVIDSADRISSTDLPVHFFGASVDEKTSLARFIHQGSARASGPFVEYNCGWLEEASCEDEIFGSFTNPGLIASAEGGTLFLDDIDLLPLRGQKMMASL